jgi:hypothetical protein
LELRGDTGGDAFFVVAERESGFATLILALFAV